MIRTILFVLFFFTITDVALSQHIQYREKEKPPVKQQASATPPPPKDSAVAEIVTPNTDCPGMDASLPVLMNYVPPEIVQKFKVKFNGHVYCITSLKISDTAFQYKLRICNNGEFVERFVDLNGIIVR